MSVLLLTMGPQLGITADLPVVGVGGAGVIRFRAIGAAGPVKWTLVDSTLPAEWDSALNPDGNAVTLTTSDAETAGTFSVTVRAVDSARIPVVRSFDVRVMALPITITGSLSAWTVGVAVSDDLTVTGGSGTYVRAGISAGSLPAGMGVSLIGSTLRVSGTPAAEGSGSVTIWVRDSDSVEGTIALQWDVEAAPPLQESEWDSARAGTGISVGGTGNRVATRSGSDAWAVVFGTVGRSAGKRFFQIRGDITLNNWLIYGVGTTATSNAGALGLADLGGCHGGCWIDNGGGSRVEFFDRLTGTWNPGSGASGGHYGPDVSMSENGLVATVAIDMDALELRFFNGEDLLFTFSIGAAQTWFPACNLYRAGVQCTLATKSDHALGDIPSALSGYTWWDE